MRIGVTENVLGKGAFLLQQPVDKLINSAVSACRISIGHAKPANLHKMYLGI
jgi:hypothetical protein